MNRQHRTAYRPRAVFAADIRRLGGVVSVNTSRDRVDGSPCFVVSHVSGGGDVVWRSVPIGDEEQARSGARVLAEFVGGVVR